MSLVTLSSSCSSGAVSVVGGGSRSCRFRSTSSSRDDANALSFSSSSTKTSRAVMRTRRRRYRHGFASAAHNSPLKSKTDPATLKNRNPANDSMIKAAQACI